MTLIDKFERAFLRVCGSSSTSTVSSASPNGCDEGGHFLNKRNDSAAKAPPRPTPPELCGSCDKLDFRTKLEHETPEESMGPLSDYLHDECPFCNIICQAVYRNWGAGWTTAKLCSESSDHVPTLYIQSRSPMAVRDHGPVEYPYPRLLLALDIEPPGFTENRRVIREVDRVKDRHIIAEIEALPGEHDTSESRHNSPVHRRPVGQEIDCDLIQRWLHDCKSHRHTLETSEQNQKAATDTNFFSSRCGFRLIDVEDECLVLKTEPCAFAALSYVWGELPTILNRCEGSKDLPVLLTTKENVDRLSAKGGLSAARIAEMGDSRIPQTVLDAFEFSRSIGMRYLWVDTLCIVQDDKDDKAFLIREMDDVYDMATVTYIAASGTDADAGLRGVSPRQGLPVNPFTFVQEGVTQYLGLCPSSLNEEVRNSKWNTRGWTFQEQSLSQRCLYFTDNEVFFNCIQLQRREAYDFDLAQEKRPDLQMRTGPPWWNRKLRKDPDPRPSRYLGDLTGTLTIQDYQEAVQTYSRRTLSHPQDVLSAFEGVFNRFSKKTAGTDLSLEQSQGIPVHHTHRALLWFPSDETKRRVCKKELDVQFSTWAWASWDGPIEFVFADSMWLSRVISQIPMKKVPIHVLVPVWYYGGTSKRFYSQTIWRASYEPSVMDGDTAEACSIAKGYARDKMGLEMDQLLSDVNDSEASCLKVGQLGFWGAYLGASDVSLVSKGGYVSRLSVGSHSGEFRFDNDQSAVDEYVAIVTSDTSVRPLRTQSILLGLASQDGVSRRAGLGWIIYSQAEDVEFPSWRNKFFRLA